MSGDAHPVYTRIPNRGLITVSGHDRFGFLQGLISNDIDLLKSQPSLYACLLTPNGKFLFDFFIAKDADTLLIDCEGGARAQALLKRLQMFKLRADVRFEIAESIDVFSILPSPTECHPELVSGYSPNLKILKQVQDDSLLDSASPDPRHPDMGLRSFEKPSNAEEMPVDFWDSRRIKLKIPDGCRDMIPEKSTLLECGIDTLNGVSFDKGCYMGQELTARMHYRGLTKKALVCVEFKDTPPPPFTDIKDENGKLIGEMRSSCGHIGLVLMKKDLMNRFEQANIGTIFTQTFL